MDENIRGLIQQLILDRNAHEVRHQEMLDRLLENAPAPNPPQASSTLHKDLSDRMEKFVYDAEENRTFERWYARYQTIFGTDATAMTNAQRVCLLTEKLTASDYDKFADTILPLDVATIPFDDAVVTLKRIFGRKESTFSLRYQCLKLEKLDGEDYAEYAARVNLRCEKFDVAHLTPEDFKVLMFVRGLKSQQDAQALAKLLGKLDQQEAQQTAATASVVVPKMTLQEAVNLATRLKELLSEKEMVSAETSHQVLATHKKQQGGSKKPTGSSESSARTFKPQCHFCPGQHYHRECPFIDKQCYTCKEIGHKAGHCESAERFNRRSFRKPSNRDRRSFKVVTGSISTRKFVEPAISDSKVKLQFDSGSDWTIISKANWHAIGSPPLSACSEQALSASGDSIPMLGRFTARIKLHDRENTGSCYVARSNLNVFGSDWMENLGLWDVPIASVCNRVNTEQNLAAKVKLDFPEVFKDGLGLCNKMKASLTLKDGAAPVFRKKRPVSFAATVPVADELKRLQLLGVITPIDYADYAAPIVVVKKSNGRIRVCADYSTGLNDSLEPNQYPLPTQEEIFAQLSQFKVFSKIDLSDAFLQVELDDEAKKLMAINTHCGLFQVNRLQPGIKTAPGIFQQLIDTMMAGASGTFPYMDDFIVGGENDDKHDQNLREALQRIQDYGFRLKLEKCSFGQREIEILGHIVNASGLRPSPEKIRMLQHVPSPADLQQLQAFLGAVTWYSKFIPWLKDLRGPLDELMRKDVDFEWQAHHQAAFEKLKEVLASDLALTHYDPAKKIIVAADASSYGMGAVLMHEMSDGSTRPVMHAASSFNKAEKNYPQVQREALALKFACTKFHKFLYGRKFELQTDHQPLLQIFGSKEGIPVYTASRLQRYALVLLAYDFTIKYVDTKSFAYADFISRLIANHDKPDEDVVIAATAAGRTVYAKNSSDQSAPLRLSDMVNVKQSSDTNAPGELAKATEKNKIGSNSNVTRAFGIRSVGTDDGKIEKSRQEDATVGCFAIDTAKQLPITFETLQLESSSCTTMKQLATFINTRWPSQQSQIKDPAVAKFFQRRDSLDVIDGCVFYGERIVIPARYRNIILETLHEGHPGAVRMKLLAREKVFWPGIDADIEKAVRKCESCASNAKAPRKCELKSWPIPKGPWSRIHIDYAGPVNGNYFLVMVDAFSKWPEIFKLSSTTTTRTISCLQETFARHGLCDTIVSDNGPQFTSAEFKEFCKRNGVEHLTSAPYHPQSNGQAERFVALLKEGLKKLEGEGNVDAVLRKFLACYRFTPSYALGMKSPFKLMTGRDMKTKLDLLKPRVIEPVKRSEKMEQQFNAHHGARWKEFQVGDSVYFQLHEHNKWKWTPGRIKEKLGAVNYTVEADIGGGRRREIKAHANQLTKRVHDDNNALLDLFDIAPPPEGEVEPLVLPEPEEQPDESIYGSAASDNSDEEVPEVPRRRTTRATAGIPPRRYSP